MTKVEAVVIRERVETVIDAVEHETGHVGVTVTEAIGHGRQRGVTHEYRGRVFESRFLPKTLGVLLICDGIALLICFVQAILFPGYEKMTYPLYPVMFIAEFGLALWLLIKGVKMKEIEPESEDDNGQREQ